MSFLILVSIFTCSSISIKVCFPIVKTTSKSPSIWFGLGLTIIDGIDTLYIMNMTDGLIRILVYELF